MSINLPTKTLPATRTTRGRSSMRLRVLLATTSILAVVMADAVGARTPRAATSQTSEAKERTFPFPITLLQEHAELHTGLDTAASLPGETGAAARRVLTLMNRHFQDEQRRVYPLLTLLPMLSKQQVEPWMAELLPMADRLRTDIDEIRRADIEISDALDTLKTAAWRESHPEVAFLAKRIRHHDMMDEEILYPAALVVGDCLRLKFPPQVTRATH
jgi:hypothetical protein